VEKFQSRDETSVHFDVDPLHRLARSGVGGASRQFTGPQSAGSVAVSKNSA